VLAVLVDVAGGYNCIHGLAEFS